MDAGNDPQSDLAYPPAAFVTVAIAAVLVGAALLVAEGRVVNLAGYALAAIVTVTCVALYRVVDNRRRGPYYSPRPIWNSLAVASIVLGITVAGVHVWRFATLVAR